MTSTCLDGWSSSEVAVFSFCVIPSQIVVGDGVKFEWAGRDNFEIASTLRAGDDFAFIDFVFFNIKIGFAFWTEHHRCPLL